jgi:UDP-glucose:glycoprotein glucosyltransferase
MEGLEFFEFITACRRASPSALPRKRAFSVLFLDHLYLPHGGFIQVYSGVITDTDADNIENYFYDFPTAMKRRNRHVVPVGDGDGLRIASLPNLHQQAGLNASSAMFIYPSKAISSSSDSLTDGNVVSERVPLSIYVIADLDTEDDLSVLRAALLFSVC